MFPNVGKNNRFIVHSEIEWTIFAFLTHHAQLLFVGMVRFNRSEAVRNLPAYYLLNGEICPLGLIQNNHVIGFTHAQLFVETVGVFIEAGVHDDIFLAACQLVQFFDQRSADTLAGTFWGQLWESPTRLLATY
jgi:hypothetical protein